MTPAVLGDKDEEGEVEKVKKVVDGDTIELVNGQKVRYIGMDTPESKKPNTPVQCYAEAAAARNAQLVEGKEVRLVKDVSETDRYGRLLRYVYVGDVFVNQELVEEGYAFSRSYPPDISKQEVLRMSEQQAREQDKGLWGSCTISPKGNKGEFVIGN
jgi:micrococcal nuclease